MQWEDGWQQAMLRTAGIPVTQFALDVVNGWQQSTPTQPWTNNPLGMPATGSSYPRALNTPYALIPSMGDFRDSFKRFAKSQTGLAIFTTLISGDSYSDAWREIHALKWPANATETDYPSALLDMVEASYRAKLAKRQAGGRKSAGQIQASPETHTAIKAQGQALTYAAQAFNSGAEAIGYLVRRLG